MEFQDQESCGHTSPEACHSPWLLGLERRFWRTWKMVITCGCARQQMKKELLLWTSHSLVHFAVYFCLMFLAASRLPRAALDSFMHGRSLSGARGLTPPWAQVHIHTHPFNGPLSGTTWASWYQKSKTISGFYWSKRQWVAVASAGPYASLHLTADRQPRQHPTTQTLAITQAITHSAMWLLLLGSSSVCMFVADCDLAFVVCYFTNQLLECWFCRFCSEV